ncbi:pteropsin4 [Daphnia pulex]|uniref:Pteropsin4 n=1 Tax=Daphnia pulex TaxID=6669 RepID=E9G0M4_DAPPU|nr:pteropsin4 [Daphnia pulex]|eukprot:EFX86931.1 pteropsin4 [Daphnia pulex]
MSISAVISAGMPYVIGVYLLTFCGRAGSLAINAVEWVDYESNSFDNSGAVLGFLMDIPQVQGDKDSFLNSSGRFTPEENLTVPTVEYYLMPVWVYWSASAYLLFISIAGLFMNIVVVVIILNDSQKMTPLNWMLLNLACSDGAIAGFGTPISAAAALKFTWPFSHELCVAYAMIMSTAGIGSITTLTVLALWRCQHVVWCPTNRNSNFTDPNGRLDRRQGALLLTFIWTYTLIVTCPPLFGWGRYDREAAHISCSVNWESKMDNNRSYILYMFAMGLFIPLMAIFVSYISILLFIHKTSNNSDTVEKRVTFMVAVMIGAFLTAWTPYSIMALVETFTGDNVTNDSVSSEIKFYAGTISPAVATVPSLFAKTSAVLNPLIYGLLNTQFRTAWEKFSSRFLGRKKRHQRSQMAMGVSHKRRRDYLRTLLNRPASDEPAIVQHPSTKEMASSQAVSCVVVSNLDVPRAPNNSYVTVNDE